ncbi:MAG: class I SAM-dependent methyltransferase [SAR324 cluster bacterium]|jgi:SAM-dependent methyltransferase|tara:strand:+ start:1475 stop:2212 length:738 start_codon:yes stop_codon:yes gene_type:complete
MDIREANNFEGIEEEVNHWWIKTRFNYINEIIKYYNSKNINIVEYGCGTCNNIYYLLKRSPHSATIKSIIGIDPNLTNIEKPDWAIDSNFLLKNSFSSTNKADIVLAMDVLEHIQDDHSALIEWKQALKPNGLLLISVPAFQHLWSGHDIFLGHYKRYNKNSLNELAESVGFHTVKINYAFSFIYPVVLLLRKLLPQTYNRNGDLKKSNKFINIILYLLGYLEYKVGGSNYFGTSVVGIFKNEER